jgi:hypothetical protein
MTNGTLNNHLPLDQHLGRLMTELAQFLDEESVTAPSGSSTDRWEDDDHVYLQVHLLDSIGVAADISVLNNQVFISIVR